MCASAGSGGRSGLGVGGSGPADRPPAGAGDRGAVCRVARGPAGVGGVARGHVMLPLSFCSVRLGRRGGSRGERAELLVPRCKRQSEGPQVRRRDLRDLRHLATSPPGAAEARRELSVGAWGRRSGHRGLEEMPAPCAPASGCAAGGRPRASSPQCSP